ncbi:hypothetical protein [Flavobacterium urocaniciphilum]|uniref:YD repeat-containing protein n=1 Tax=Flavobacterium urocaniciphilum TaxID=1299341 RepID=A0A1H8YSR3_9FLAO|nr:hypothetical protein [Flavobacterium urocaniciphilum]SEP55235.1 hypothetical protein SAMN05444005_101159 [Flavobacterium urocaniciphilum]
MKNLILTLTVFFLNTPLVFSQTSIPSELMNKPRTEELYKVNDTKIDKLTVTETNYLEDVTYTNKWVYNYSNDSIIKGNYYKDDELKSNFEYLINKDNKIIESKVLFYDDLGINEKLHIKYIVNDSLKILILLDENLNIERKMIVEMDSLKSPIKITSIKNEKIEAVETAEYNYKSNTYKYKVYNSFNKLVLNKIDFFNYDFIIEKNEFGDILKMITPISQNKSITTFEYKYDKNKNWIKRITKTIINNEEVTTSVVRRNITYIK